MRGVDRSRLARLRGLSVLVVESPALPVLLLQPWGGSFPAGSYHALSVLAAGEEPLVYQWYHDEESVQAFFRARLLD